jgi:GntR family transcriptional regulator
MWRRASPWRGAGSGVRSEPMTRLARTYQRSRIPLYLQVASTLERRIELGQWKPGEKISTLAELEAEFQVARVTVRQAIDVLQKEGLVRCMQGKGTFVAQEIVDKRWLKLETEWSALIGTIEDNVPRFIARPDAPALPKLRDEDGRPAGEYTYLWSVQSRARLPYALASVHLARDIHDRAPEAFRSRVALAVLPTIDGLTIARAHQTLVIGMADTETASLLGISLNAPTAEAHCVVTDAAGVAVYVADLIYRGDCVRLDIDLLPGRAIGGG